jgi:hypothetical protein
MSLLKDHFSPTNNALLVQNQAPLAQNQQQLHLAALNLDNPVLPLVALVPLPQAPWAQQNQHLCLPCGRPRVLWVSRLILTENEVLILQILIVPLALVGLQMALTIVHLQCVLLLIFIMHSLTTIRRGV